MDLLDSRLQPGPSLLELLRGFSVAVEKVKEQVGVAAGGTGVVEAADSFQAQCFPVRLHVPGFFLDEILGGKWPVAMGAFSEHGPGPLHKQGGEFAQAKG